MTTKAEAPRRQKRRADELTEKEKLFVLHYLGAARSNATEAAVLAGYAPGSRDGARRTAHELMRRPRVLAELDRLTAERNHALHVTAEDVLRDLLVLKAELASCGKSAPAMRTRLSTIQAIGEHVAVNAFRRQVGLSSPTGGPIETADATMLAGLSDEELDQLDRARTILDRKAGNAPPLPDGSGDPGGEGTEA